MESIQGYQFGEDQANPGEYFLVEVDAEGQPRMSTIIYFESLAELEAAVSSLKA